MKNILITAFVTITTMAAYSQSNSFPANGNVGIGTMTPSSALDIAGLIQISGINSAIPPSGLSYGLFGYGGVGLGIYSGASGPNQGIGFWTNLNNVKSEVVRINNGGNVGIGSITPRERLDIGGRAIIQNTLQTNDYMYTGQHHGQLRILNGLGVYGSKALEFALMDNGTAVIQSNESGVGYNTLVLNPVLGDVGIGTIDPKGYKLAVNGKIRAQEIKVETANWPDYVFTKSYQLPSLQETEKHIKEKGHLPGIPSAAEVKTNGIDLGEMNAKLLQKIEELTLYLIENKKETDLFKNTIDELKKENQIFKSTLEEIILKLK